MVPRLVLSLFPGIDLFGRGFEEEGYCVVRGPDLIFGGDVRTFRAPDLAFEGIIGGPPCQDFSRANRPRARRDGTSLLHHFARIVRDSAGAWFLCENVPGVPELAVQGFHVQRFTIDAREVGNPQSRNRMIQFGSRDGSTIAVERVTVRRGDPFEPCVMATEGRRVTRRSFARCCELQGLPPSFELPDFTIEGAYRAVGNGVPLQLARALARAVAARAVTHESAKCLCGCGRDVPAPGLQAGPACRKRMQRRRDRASRAA
jgi:DNA (cytosine-5)-methyltransferase 1